LDTAERAMLRSAWRTVPARSPGDVVLDPMSGIVVTLA
jgi:hypothetical protein